MDEILLNSIKTEFRINELFLFGNVSVQSDLDILIVSDDFTNISISKRKMLIKKSSHKLDPICLTPIEFNKLKSSKSSLWHIISTKGQKII
jgi:predicted nucleotidyltransferase